MSTDILILREKLVKITQILADKGITVTQRGTDAYVRYNAKTGKPESVNLPMIPENASPALIAAIEGFLDHEVGHLLFSNSDVLLAAHKMGKRVAAMHNIVEDTFVERRMRERFPGSDFNLSTMGQFFLKEVTIPNLHKCPSPAEKLNWLMVPMVRAWAGQSVFQDFMADKWDAMKPVVEKIGPLKDRLPTIQSSHEALSLAAEIDGVLRKPEPPVPPAASSDEKEGEPTESSEGVATGKSERPGDKDESVEAPEAPEPVDDEPESEEPKSEGEADADETPESADETPEGEDDTKTTEGEEETNEDDDTAGSPDGEDDDGEEDDRDAEGDGDSSAGVEADEEANDDGDTSGSDGTGETDGSDGDEDDDADGTGDGEADGDDAGDMGPAAGPRDWEFDPADAMPDELSTFDKELGSKIGEKAADAMKASDYRIFTRDFDMIEPLAVSEHFDTTLVAQLDEETRAMVGIMQKDLERMMAARSKVIRYPGQRSGRVHSASLHRLAVGDSRVFYRKQEHQSHDTAVTLLVDCSGSMSGSPISIAAKSAYALSMVLERIGVRHEVIGFTTRGAYGGVPGLSSSMIDAAQSAAGVIYSRWEALYMPILKGFDERLTPQVKARFAALAHGYCRLEENVDGECVEIAAHRLAQQRASRRVLIVLSDGEPSCKVQPNKALSSRALGEAYGSQGRYLKQIAEKIQKSDMELVAIGIESDAPRSFYKNYTILHSMDQLPGQVMGELRKILL